jgi:hypothetical protein
MVSAWWHLHCRSELKACVSVCVCVCVLHACVCDDLFTNWRRKRCTYILAIKWIRAALQGAVYTYINTHKWMYIHTYVCIYIYTYIYTCIHAHTYIHTHKWMYIYVCMYVYIYIYIYTYTITNHVPRISVFRHSTHATCLLRLTKSLLANVRVYFCCSQIGDQTHVFRKRAGHCRTCHESNSTSSAL